MSQNMTLLDETWGSVSATLKKIFQIQSMLPGEFMSLYNLVERYFRSSEYSERILASASNRPKPNDKSEKEEENVEEVHKTLAGSELYLNTKNFFKTYLENIASNGNNLQGERFLQFYAKTWEKYQYSSQVANAILSTINRNWVSRQQRDKVKEIFDIYTVAMHIWQDIFFKEPTQSLSQTCLNLINQERNGINIDASLIRQVVQSYVSAGFIKAEKSSTDYRSISAALSTYVDYFEKQFLQETEQFYTRESAEFLEKNSINVYMKKINQRIQEEENRVKVFLHPTTLEKIQGLLVTVLIKKQIEVLQIEAFKLLREGKIEDLAILYNLVNRVPKANEPIQADLEKYIYENGMNAISSISATANKDPKTYVEAIIEVYEKFARVVEEAFSNDAGYKASLDRAFSKFVNDNAVTQEAKKSTKSPELLAKYSDMLLKKGTKINESDVEGKIKQIMVVFNYVEDKDVFQKYYGRLLAKRLVNQLSTSDDYEESMISKLKAACGFEYASKLQRMFQDMTVSTSLVGEYNTYCTNKCLTDIVDFSCMVLTSNAWPFTVPTTFNLPAELKRTAESFRNFYSTKFTGRKLEWLHQFCKGDIQTLYTKPKYTFQVSTYQMAILLLFNEFHTITVERIYEKTQIESELFTQVLHGLLKTKVLICSQINVDELGDNFKETDIKLDHIIQVDETYKSKKIKLNLNAPIKSVEQKEGEAVNQSIDEDRKFVIQAAIVRIMKARKTLKHALLVQEVIPQLTSRFKPQIPMIKKQIDILIEKEYLERDQKEKDLFHYLA